MELFSAATTQRVGTRQQLSKLNEPDKVLKLPGSTLQPVTTKCRTWVCTSPYGWWRQTVCQDLLFSWNPPLCRRWNYIHAGPHTHSFSTGLLQQSILVVRTLLTLRLLQRVQDATARLLCRQPHGTNARPLLKQLHWLPVAESSSNSVLWKSASLYSTILHYRSLLQCPCYLWNGWR